jgi:hypothetical protein
MTAPVNPVDPPMAEPGKRPSGGNVGAVKRKDDDDEDEWRHAPVAPVDERNPLRSLGNAVGDTVTGSDANTPAPPKR